MPPRWGLGIFGETLPEASAPGYKQVAVTRLYEVLILDPSFVLRVTRAFVVGASVHDSAGAHGAGTAPLLVEVFNICRRALVAERADPIVAV